MREPCSARRTVPLAPVRKKHRRAFHIGMPTCLLLSSAAFLSDSACSALSKAFSLSSLSICIFFLMASMAAYCRWVSAQKMKKTKESEWKDRSVWSTPNAKLECELAWAAVSPICSSAGQLLDTQYFFGNNCSCLPARDLSFYWISAVIGSSKRFDSLCDYTWGSDVRRTLPFTPRRPLLLPTPSKWHAGSRVSRGGGSSEWGLFGRNILIVMT